MWTPVLLAEDESSVRELVARTLRGAGYEVVEADSMRRLAATR